MEHVFDSEALGWFARRADPITLGDQGWKTPDWGALLKALTWLFALDREKHFLKQPPGVLPRLWERQMTQALRAVLLNDPTRTRQRSQALFDALEGPGRIRLAHVDRIVADDKARKNLAIHVIVENGARHCLVIEAKFEFELSDRQLAKYRDALRMAYPSSHAGHAGERDLQIPMDLGSTGKHGASSQIRRSAALRACLLHACWTTARPAASALSH